MKVELDLPNYATKADLKGATGVDTSNLAEKSNLARLKDEMDKIDVDKLKTLPTDLSKLRNVVDNDVIENCKFFAKVNAINTNGFVLKTQYNTDKLGLKKKIDDVDQKILDTNGPVKNTDYNARITQIKGPGITGLATTTLLTAVENNIPNINNLFKKHILMQKYLILSLNNLLHLIPISLHVIYLMQG